MFTVGTDGSGEQQVTHPSPGTTDDQPDWSPDGKLIAFKRCSDAAGCQAFTVAADGGPVRQVHVRRRVGGACDVSAPTWTPNGQLLVVLAQGQEKVNGSDRQIQQASLEMFDLTRGTQRTILKRTLVAARVPDHPLPLSPVTDCPGFRTRDELIGRYADETGRDVSHWIGIRRLRCGRGQCSARRSRAAIYATSAAISGRAPCATACRACWTWPRNSSDQLTQLA